MRRVWYVYGIWQIKQQVTSKVFWQGIVFGGSLIMFAQVVHVASVLQNTLDTPLGLVPQYVLGAIFNAIQSGELVKIITLLFLVSITISVIKKLIPLARTIQSRQVV